MKYGNGGGNKQCRKLRNGVMAEENMTMKKY